MKKILLLLILIFITNTSTTPAITEKHTLQKWSSDIKKIIATKNGILKIENNPSITFEWELIEAQSPELNAIIKNVNIIVDTYAQMEFDFARKNPNLIPQDLFLKYLAPLFKDEAVNINWDEVKKQIKQHLDNFFTTTNFAQFFQPNDMILFVIAKDENNTPIGIIQFLINADYEYGTVKVAFYGIKESNKKEVIQKLLMASVFKLIPETTRIFLHTRNTNVNTIALYHSWNFTNFPGVMPHWVNMEYIASAHDTLQKTAHNFIKE